MGKVAVLRETESMVIYHIASVFLNQGGSLEMPLKAALPSVEEKLSKGKSFLKGKLTVNSCRCTGCVLVSVVPSGRRLPWTFFYSHYRFSKPLEEICFLEGLGQQSTLFFHKWMRFNCRVTAALLM